MSDKRPSTHSDTRPSDGQFTATRLLHSLDSRPLDIGSFTGPVFVTGTDTEIGKTYVAARLIRRLRQAGRSVGAYKPVASGCVADDRSELVSEDAVALWRAAGQPGNLDAVCPQRFRLPLAPPTAAAAEGKRIDPDRLLSGARWWLDRYEVVVIEGAGGLLSPLADDWLNADLALRLNAPLIVVAPNRLGTINHVLLTLIAARSMGIAVAGVVLNQLEGDADASAATNAAAIERHSGVPVLASIANKGEWP